MLVLVLSAYFIDGCLFLNEGVGMQRDYNYMQLNGVSVIIKMK